MKRYRVVKRDKRAVSPVIATVLIVLISIIAVSILAAYVIPIVTNQPREAQACFDTTGKLKIDTGSGFSCYNSTNLETSITVKLSDILIEGIAVSIEGGGEARRFDVINSTTNPKIRMLNKFYNVNLEMPGKGESRTYVFNTSALNGVSGAEISPMVEGKVCESTDSVKLSVCN